MIYYYRDALPSDEWVHPDVRAFLSAHAKRFDAIRQRDWQREFDAADTMTQVTMMCLRNYDKMLMSSGSAVFGLMGDSGTV